MKVGDLVEFHTDAWCFKHAENRYTNPGIVLDVVPGAYSPASAEVLWSDGKITKEFESYLRLSQEAANESR